MSGAAERNNAKPVEVYDLDGNHIQTYRSGKAASEALGVQQSEVSQCCRGIKASFGGYKFKFPDELYQRTAELSKKNLKRGYAIEYIAEANYANPHANPYLSGNTLGQSAGGVGLGGGVGGGMGGGVGYGVASSANLAGLGGFGSSANLLDAQFLTRSSRTSRASRGDHVMDESKKEQSSKALAQIKTRKWTKQMVTIGSLQIMKWVPNKDKATAELQLHNTSDSHNHPAKKSRSNPNSSRSKGRKKN